MQASMIAVFTDQVWFRSNFKNCWANLSAVLRDTPPAAQTVNSKRGFNGELQCNVCVIAAQSVPCWLFLSRLCVR